MLRVVDEKIGQRRRCHAPEAVDEGVEPVEFARVDEVTGQTAEDGRKGTEQGRVDAKRPVRRDVRLPPGLAQDQVVGNVREGILESAGRFRPADAQTFTRNAFTRNETLGRLLIQAVADPQAQLISDAVEVVREVAAVDRLDEQAQVLSVVLRSPQHLVEAGVRPVVEPEDVLAAVRMLEVEAPLQGEEASPVPLSVLAASLVSHIFRTTPATIGSQRGPVATAS